MFATFSSICFSKTWRSIELFREEVDVVLADSGRTFNNENNHSARKRTSNTHLKHSHVWSNEQLSWLV